MRNYEKHCALGPTVCVVNMFLFYNNFFGSPDSTRDTETFCGDYPTNGPQIFHNSNKNDFIS